MPVNRSTRTLLAAVFLIAALFIAMNYAVEATPLLGWWLPLVLLILGVALIVSSRFTTGADEVTAEPAAPASLHDYSFAATAASPQLDAGQGIPTQPVQPPSPEVSSAERLQTDGIVLQPADTAENEFHTGEHVAHTLPTEAPTEINQTTGEGTGAGHAPIAPEERAVLDAQAAPDQSQNAVQANAPDVVEAVMNDTNREAAAAGLTQSETVASAPSSGSTADNLTIIHGIGPKIAGALQAVGIDSYTKLSAASDADLESAIHAAGVRLAPTLNTWREQAEFLARGDRDGFESLRRKLTQGGISSGD